MFKFCKTIYFIFYVIFQGSCASAEVKLLDQNDWKVSLTGFIEVDALVDSTRSLTDIAGNRPVDALGTVNGSNGRTDFSLRNSRLGVRVNSPDPGDWSFQAYVEADLWGYDPDPASGISNSENNFLTAPTFRLRHAYFKASVDTWDVLVGQTWSLFAWQPIYVLPSVSVNPITATAYSRTPQVTVLKSYTWDDTTLQAGLSAQRPVQRDSQFPNLDWGARLSLASRQALYGSTVSAVGPMPMSLGISGTVREFETPTAGGAASDQTRYWGSAIALDTMIPLLASTDTADPDHSLLLMAEASIGQGYGDEFSGWTGNLAQNLSLGTTPSNQVNLDGGLGDYDSNGNFQLVHLHTWNVNLQYHLPTGWDTFFDLGYSQLYSSNIGSLVSATTGLTTAGRVPFSRAETYFLNAFHDFTSKLRVGLEWAQFRSTYSTGVVAQDNRVQLSSWFRF